MIMSNYICASWFHELLNMSSVNGECPTTLMIHGGKACRIIAAGRVSQMPTGSAKCRLVLKTACRWDLAAVLPKAAGVPYDIGGLGNVWSSRRHLTV
jgi:hypothetical protein